MQTYQDFEKAAGSQATTVAFIAKAISQHMASEEWRTARDADLYDKQKNVTINRLAQAYRAATVNSGGNAGEGPDMAIASNWFNRFNVQRCSYLLGNGVSFTRREKRKNDKGYLIDVDVIKEALGVRFDTDLFWWGYTALIHGVSFGLWSKNKYDKERLRVLPLTSFVPLWDEDTGALRAGIKFWRLAPDRPMQVELYTEQGITEYRSKDNTTGMDLVAVNDKPMPYAVTEYSTANDGVIAEEPLESTTLPIIPMWSSYKKQSTLVGFRDNIDAYDLIKSGFANDQRDCAKVYWLIENCGGMKKKELDEFLDDIRYRHIAQVDSTSFSGDARASLSPYTVDVPYQGNEAVLDRLAKDMYRDFGAVDTSSINAGATNDEIDAAYQPLDEEADLFEVQVIDAVQQLLALMGIEDTPQFKRNRVSNVKETVDAVMNCASYLDHEAVLDHLPFITVDEKGAILQRMDMQNAARLIDPGKKRTGEANDATGGEGDEGGTAA